MGNGRHKIELHKGTRDIKEAIENESKLGIRDKMEVNRNIHEEGKMHLKLSKRQ